MGDTVLQVRTIFTGVTGSPWYSNIFFGADGAEPEAESASNQVQSFWSSIVSSMSSQVTAQVQPNVVRYQTTTSEVQSVSVVPQTPMTGAVAGELLPTATQGLITLTTGVYRFGRPIIGKIYIPGLTEAENGNGVVVAPRVAAWQTSIDNLVDGDPATAQLCVYSRSRIVSLVPVPTARPGAESVVIGGSAKSKWAILRTRRD